MGRKIAVIGAGPIGLETALAALERGHEVEVFERGSVGESVRRWGHVRMFTPFGMNVSERGMKRLMQTRKDFPKPEAILTGREYMAEYLAPLADSLEENIHTNAEVISIGRVAILKGEKIGEPDRGGNQFRLLLRRGQREWNEHADLVFDCSGTFSQPNNLGDGGIPAVGESASRDMIYYGVPDVSGRSLAQFAGARSLVVGAGHSAATVVRDLAVLKLTAPTTRIIWATRANDDPPCQRVAQDPLKERDNLAIQANALTKAGVVEFRPGHSVLSVNRTPAGLEVVLVNGTGEKTITVDRLVAAVGFRPDLELARELQARTCFATEASYQLAHGIGGGAESLVHPEPGYFALGIKSFGRRPGFLIHSGREQVEALMDWIERN